jgi:hypothetical protein
VFGHPLWSAGDFERAPEQAAKATTPMRSTLRAVNSKSPWMGMATLHVIGLRPLRSA